MSLSLAFRFVAGRYHATPHGHHVNEGLIEWPPSPWRLLRSLISIGYTSGVWNSTGPTSVARSLIEKLSSDLPCYYLPSVIGTHSRHYMPIGELNSKTKMEKTKLVFDTWARVEDQELVISWNDMPLDKAELSLLAVLVERLNYLGRSESWVEGRVVGKEDLTPVANCFTEKHGDRPGRGWEQMALLASISASDFIAWRSQEIRKALVELPLPKGKKPSKMLLRKRDKAVDPYPHDLLDCLQKDTTWLRSHGWSQPPGSRRVLYWRPSNAIAVGAPRTIRATQPSQPVEAMLLSLTNSSRNDHALPPVTRTLPQAELLHRALVGIAIQNGVAPPELTGRNENRRPLRGPHKHAHVNPLDLDGDGHLDHILIWALMGLSANAQVAIRALRRTFTKGGIEPLRLALAASGDLQDVVKLPGPLGQRINRLTSDCMSWQSVTPFVPPRYIKARGKNTLEGQIRAELHSRGFSAPTAVHQLAPVPVTRKVEALAPKWHRFRHFVLSRRHGPEPPIKCGFAVQLEFEHPVCGPIALGYGSHFGLGLFES